LPYQNREAFSGLASGSDAVANWFASSSLKLVWQKHHFYSSPGRFAHLVWNFLTNIRSQFEIFRLLGAPIFKSVVRLDPIFPFKYLTRDYLGRGLSTKECAACFIRHYRRLHDVIPAPTLAQILHRNVTLLEKEVDGRLFRIRASRARDEVNEGELVLALDVDGKKTYILQFTIVPGWVVQSEAPEVFLVSRLQGMKGCYGEVRLASKAFLEVAPPALLLAALHGFAQVFGVEEMAGISAESQFCYLKGDSQLFQSAYDDYWTELGAKKISARFFASPIPPQEKSIEGIKNGHKSRTRKKREFKKQVAEQIFHQLLGTEPDLLRSAVDSAQLELHAVER
jgi:uncharacterized protein VirK/YbjX